jgi:hypothetical protein
MSSHNRFHEPPIEVKVLWEIKEKRHHVNDKNAPYGENEDLHESSLDTPLRSERING